MARSLRIEYSEAVYPVASPVHLYRKSGGQDGRRTEEEGTNRHKHQSSSGEPPILSGRNCKWSPNSLYYRKMDPEGWQFQARSEIFGPLTLLNTAQFQPG